jgi:hypothetical protein
MAMVEQDKYQHARENAKAWFESIQEMVEANNKANEECGNADGALQEIHNSVLSVEVRGGWRVLGGDDGQAEEYNILLSTGGPALRIFGQLNSWGEPESAELQMQDWGVPWTRYAAAEAMLLEFARCFYFGE